jgi:3-carboxy-cis,cis-muconate cycloisomerase
VTALLWPGDARAGDLLGDAVVLVAMAEVEQAWVEALVAAGIAPPAAAVRLAELVTDVDAEVVAAGAEGTGTPVVPLVALLRERLREAHPDAARWLHRGLTSQDVLDTALVLALRDAVQRVREELVAQVAALAGFVRWHRTTIMAGRTLTQHAVPVTLGLKAATWLVTVLDAADGVRALRWPVQLGGAAGTLAAPVELAARHGAADPVAVALDLVRRTASALGLEAAPPWHTARAPLVRVADSLLACTDAYGRIANDVLTLARPEIGELREPSAPGSGGSSTMPQKVNPVLATLIRRAALSGPALAAQLHLAAAEAVDERSPGPWHAEWQPLQLLGRRTVVAAAQTTELLTGLHVDTGRMRSTLATATADLLAERRSLAEPAPGELAPDFDPDPDTDPASYLGAADALVDAVLARADAVLRQEGEP